MSVLVKLRSCSFDITSYIESSDQNRQVKHHLVAEKHKVLRALAGSKAKVVVAKPQAPSQIKDCAPSVTRVSEALNVEPAHQ